MTDATNTPTDALEQLLAERAAFVAATPVDPKAQAMAERFRDAVLAKANRTAGEAGAEVKQFEVQPREGGGAYVLVECGRVGDEGTMAAIWCREYRHVAIGARGGIRLLNAKGKRDLNGWRNALWTAVR